MFNARWRKFAQAVKRASRITLPPASFTGSSPSTVRRCSSVRRVLPTGVLKDRGQLEEIGGEHWLSALYDFVPTAANAAWYADIIRDRWERRRAISDGKQQIDLANDLSVDNWDADGKYQSRSPALQLIEFLLITKEVVGIHVFLTRSLFGGDIPHRLLAHVSRARSTSAPLRF